MADPTTQAAVGRPTLDQAILIVTGRASNVEHYAVALREARECHGYGAEATSQWHREQGDDLERRAVANDTEAAAYRLVLSAISTHAARIAELGEAKEGLQSAEAWLDRWARHVGNCAQGPHCTCGLVRVQYDVQQALCAFETDPEPAQPAAPSLPADVVVLVKAAREGLICAEADLEEQKQSCVEDGEDPGDDQAHQVFKARRDLIKAALAPFADRRPEDSASRIMAGLQDAVDGNVTIVAPPAVAEHTEGEG